MRGFRELIQTLAGVMSQNSKVRAIAYVLVALATVMTVFSLTFRFLGSEREAEQTGEKYVQVSEADQRTIAGYGDAEKALAETLASLEWTNRDGDIIRFTEDSVTVNGGDPEPFVILDLDQDSYERVASSSEGSEKVAQTLAVTRLGGETHALVLEQTSKKDADDAWTVRCDWFPSAERYTGTQPKGDIAVSGLTDQVVTNFGGDKDKVMQAVLEWKQTKAPLASEVTIGSAISVDAEKGTATVGVTGNDLAKSSGTLTYDASNQYLTVK